jgi:uncharacterized SAM-binding protein YcdF (DUF218 family)
MFFLLSKILEFFLLPLTWILLLFMAGWYLGTRGKRFLIASGLLLIFFTNPFILNLAMKAWEVPGRNNHSIREPYDVVIVLGGSMRYYNGALERPVYSSSADRLLQAIALYQSGKVKKILLTGGSGRILFPQERESVLLSKVLLDSGIPAADILLENESRNTYQNAVETSLILSKGSYGKRFLILTSAYHMRRTLACFHKAGIQGDPWPVDQRAGEGTLTPDRIIIPDGSVLASWNILFHEWFGVLVYKVAGYC